MSGQERLDDARVREIAESEPIPYVATVSHDESQSLAREVLERRALARQLSEAMADERAALECDLAAARAQIAAQAEALAVAEGALREARWPHYHCEDSWYSCPLAEDGCADDRTPKGVCDCGATKANARIDGALAAVAKARGG